MLRAKHDLKLLVAVLAACLCAGVVIVPQLRAAVPAAGANALAPPAAFATAIPVAAVAGPLSKGEPDQCEALTTAKVAVLESQRPDGGYAVSPGDVELRNVQPATTYRSCITIINYDEKAPPIHVKLDDVDVQASDGIDAGVELVVSRNGVGSWVVPSVRAVDIPSGHKAIIPYLIRTPDHLPAGTTIGGVRIKIKQGGFEQNINQRIYVSNPGGAQRQLDVRDVSSNRLLGQAKSRHLHVHFTVVNRSDYLETFRAKIELKGLGRTVRETDVTGGSLLPSGKLRLDGAIDDMPWIGIYHPKLSVIGRQGATSVQLPWVIVLPPTLYVIAIVLAILLPIGVLLWRWRRNRLEWMQYLEDYDEDDDVEAGDEAWDPAAYAPDDFTQQ